MATLASVIGRGVVASRPAAGTAGQLWFATDVSGGTLQRDNGSTWDNVEGAGGGGATTFSWTGKSANYTITPADSGILVDTSGGAITITLPTAVSATQRYAIKKKTSDASAVTINTTSAQTVDGIASGSYTLTAQNQSIEVESDGNNWYIVAHSGAGYADAKLGSDVNITPINTYVDGPSVTLGPGTWEIKARAQLYCGTGNPAVVGAKLWDGTTTYDSGNLRSLGGIEGCVPLFAVVTPTTSTTYKISAITTSVTGTPQINAAMDTNSAGNNATHILATRIG